jgi:hypothetical protein
MGSNGSRRDGVHHPGFAGPPLVRRRTAISRIFRNKLFPKNPLEGKWIGSNPTSMVVAPLGAKQSRDTTWPDIENRGDDKEIMVSCQVTTTAWPWGCSVYDLPMKVSALKAINRISSICTG